MKNEHLLGMRIVEKKYAKKFCCMGSIKFNCADNWIQNGLKYGNGQGDEFEATFGSCNLCDIENVLHFISKYPEARTKYKNGRVYFRRSSVCEMPAFCFYTFERDDDQSFKIKVPKKYIIDFTGVDNYKDFWSKYIEGKHCFEKRCNTPVLLFFKLDSFRDNLYRKFRILGVDENKIKIKKIEYENIHTLFHAEGQSGMELFIKSKADFKHQNELRIVILSSDPEEATKLKKPICIGRMKTSCQIIDITEDMFDNTKEDAFIVSFQARS